MPKDETEKKPKSKTERSPRFFVQFHRSKDDSRIEYVGPKRDDCTKNAISAFLTDEEDAHDIAAMWQRFLPSAQVEVEPVR